jgi:hypothetical protein
MVLLRTLEYWMYQERWHLLRETGKMDYSPLPKS